ncbi:malate synthase A [Cryptosporangium sp. NPDC048952]|uniref:malate synthase A n=1 Tax=Cryptosporangium sp. NPDC048952 TaxID=3363961 RepID=UPI003711A20D
MSGVESTPTTVDGAETILSTEALEFLADLHRTFGARRNELLERRKTRRAEIARTGKLDFLAETASIRDDEAWKVAKAPKDLQDRRVEITGPTDPKMTINALNSGAKVWLADLEDANTPHWDNVVGGQVSLYRATRRELSFKSGEKSYELNDENLAVVVTRPRGWHLDEEHITVDGEPIAGGIVDFGLYFFHNAKELLARGSGPYFYLPKTESHLEARLWNEIFTHSEARLGLKNCIRATVLIETITAAFEMDEILFELREHASGLNAGRWDYLFSVIKNFRDAGPEFVLPDRAKVTMTAPFMRAYTELLVATCHKRGAFAMGGMAAFIPSRRDPEVNEKALAQVKADKDREAGDGFDGSWVAHPDLVPVCKDAFDAVLKDKPNQVDRLRPDVHVAASDLLNVANTPGEVTEEGVRSNVSVALQYLKAWIGGLGAVAINNLMEDAATAEISRSQVWQWVHQGTILDTGETVTESLVRRLLDEEVAKLGEGYDQARTLFEQVALADDFVDFLTLPAYALVR